MLRHCVQPFRALTLDLLAVWRASLPLVRGGLILFCRRKSSTCSLVVWLVVDSLSLVCLRKRLAALVLLLAQHHWVAVLLLRAHQAQGILLLVGWVLLSWFAQVVPSELSHVFEYGLVSASSLSVVGASSFVGGLIRDFHICDCCKSTEQLLVSDVVLPPAPEASKNVSGLLK